MKKVGVVLALIATSCSAFANDLQVTVIRKKLNATEKFKSFHKGGTSDPTAINPGVKGAKTQEIAYTVNVSNSTFSAMPKLQARYILFVERQELGKKKGTEQIERINGEGSVEEMVAKGKTSFETTSVQLHERSLSGDWIYRNGGRLKSVDSLVGIWIKFFDGDKEVGEFINPTTLANRHKWE